MSRLQFCQMSVVLGKIIPSNLAKCKSIWAKCLNESSLGKILHAFFVIWNQITMLTLTKMPVILGKMPPSIYPNSTNELEKSLYIFTLSISSFALMPFLILTTLQFVACQAQIGQSVLMLKKKVNIISIVQLFHFLLTPKRFKMIFLFTFFK